MPQKLLLTAMMLTCQHTFAAPDIQIPPPEFAQIEHLQTVHDNGVQHSQFGVIRTDVRNVVWIGDLEMKLTASDSHRQVRIVRYDRHCRAVASANRIEAQFACDNLEARIDERRIDAVYQSLWREFSFAFELEQDLRDPEVWRLRLSGLEFAPGLAVRIRPAGELLQVLWLMKDQGVHRNYAEYSRQEVRDLGLSEREFALLVAMDLLSDAADFGEPGRLRLPPQRSSLAKASGVLEIMGTPIECTGVGGQVDEFCTEDTHDRDCKGGMAFCDFCDKLPGGGWVLESCGAGAPGFGLGGGGVGGWSPNPDPGDDNPVTPKPNLRALGGGDHPRILTVVTGPGGRQEVTLTGMFINSGTAGTGASARVFWNSVPMDGSAPTYFDWDDWNSYLSLPPYFGMCADGSPSIPPLAAGSTALEGGYFTCDPNDLAAKRGLNGITYVVDARKSIAESKEGDNGGVANGNYFIP